MSYNAPHTVLDNQRYIIYDLMKEYTRPGSVVIDVGAQTGQEARFLALHIGASGHIYSFEPVPHLAQRIKDWMAGITSTGMTQESLGNITLIEKAVHCVGGQKKTFLQDDNHVPASSFIKECIDAWKGAPQFGGILTDYTEIIVETVALDDLFSNKRIDFIKCDAEGAGPYVLLGAQNIINSSSSPNKSLLPVVQLTTTLFTMNSSFLITTPERPQDKFTTLLKLSVSSVGSITCLPCSSLWICNRLPRLSSNKKQ